MEIGAKGEVNDFAISVVPLSNCYLYCSLHTRVEIAYSVLK